MQQKMQLRDWKKCSCGAGPTTTLRGKKEERKTGSGGAAGSTTIRSAKREEDGGRKALPSDHARGQYH